MEKQEWFTYTYDFGDDWQYRVTIAFDGEKGLIVSKLAKNKNKPIRSSMYKADDLLKQLVDVIKSMHFHMFGNNIGRASELGIDKESNWQIC